jgi:hypothetical protein
MITVLPEGGLCNRMRVVASARLLSVAAGQPMQVLWHRTPDFNSRFDALFSSRNLPFEVVERNAMLRPQRAMFRASEILAKLRGQIVLSHQDTRPGQFDLTTTLLKLSGRDAWIRTNSRLLVEPEMYSLFRPTGEAADRIAELLPRLQHSVGVHIRGTDNAKAKTESPLESFLTQMRAELQTSPETNFFVATDEPATLANLRTEFGDRVWEYRKRAYARSDQTAIVDAVVDLFALGECNRLIGSYWSSFTDTAAELRGIPCTIARA